VAVVALDSVGAAESGLPVRFDGGGRRADPALVRSVEAALERASPEAPRPTTPRLLRQAVQLVAPVAVVGAQAPFVIDGVPAVQIGGADDVARAGPASRRRLEGVGLAVARLVQALEEDVPTSGTGDTYLYTRGQVLDGRALGVVVAALLAGPLLLAGRLLAGGVSHRLALLPPFAAAGRLVLPLAGGLAGARLAAAVGLTGDAPAAPTAGLGAVVLTLAGGALGLAAVRFVPRSRRSSGADGPPGRADWTVALVLGGLGACLALVANPFSALPPRARAATPGSCCRGCRGPARQVGWRSSGCPWCCPRWPSRWTCASAPSTSWAPSEARCCRARRRSDWRWGWRPPSS
jgi:hypothetical protein